MNFRTFLLTLTSSLLATTLSAKTIDNASFIQSIAIKGGVNAALISSDSSTEPALTLNELSTVGSIVGVNMVFNTDFIPYFKPYIDFSGMIFNDRYYLVPTLGLQHNFDFKDSNFEPFISFGAGYNYRTWSQNPLANSTEPMPESSGSFDFSVQAGSDYYITKNLALDLTLRYDLYNFEHTYKSITSQSSIKDPSAFSLLFGFVYHFSTDSRPYNSSGVSEEETLTPTPQEQDQNKSVVVATAVVATDLNTSTSATLDNDEDGVINQKDNCPDTMVSVPVGNDGCAFANFDFIFNYDQKSFKIDDLRAKPEFDIIGFLLENENYSVRLYTTTKDKKLSKRYLKEIKKFLIWQDVHSSRIKMIAKPTHAKEIQKSQPKGYEQVVMELFDTNKKSVVYLPKSATAKKH